MATKTVRTTRENDKPYAICGSENSAGGTCGLRSGTGTSHKGVGRCYLHGGTQETPRNLVKKYGMASMVNHASIKEAVEKLREVRGDNVYDMREHVLLCEAIAQEVLSRAGTTTDLLDTVRIIREATKIIKDLHEIEQGRRLVIDIQGASIFLDKVKETIHRYVRDEYTRNLIGTEMANIRLGNGPLALAEVNPIEAEVVG